MKNKTQILIGIILICIFSACEKDFDFNNNYDSKIPVLNCRFKTDEVFKVSLTWDMNIDSNRIKSIENADVKIYEDGILFEKLHYEPLSDRPYFGYYVSTKKCKAEHTYKIVVEHPSFKTVEASSKSVKNVVLEHVNHSMYTTSTGILIQKAQIRIEDPSDEKNRYAFFVIDSLVRKQYTGTDTIAYPIYTNTPIRRIPGSGFVRYLNIPYVSDSSFNGQAKELAIHYVVSTGDKPIDLIRYSYYIILRNVSEPYFLYEQSINEYYNRDLSDYEEVPPLYTNVKNGLGVFCSYSERYVFYRVK